LLAEQSRYCAKLLRHGLHGAIHPQHRGGQRAYLARMLRMSSRTLAISARMLFSSACLDLSP
jgi:hypothetical protein